MKTNIKHNKLLKKGVTLIELTVVIVVILALVGVLFVGASAWKDGADRATCILNMRNMQQAAGSYANMHPDEVATNLGLVTVANITAKGFASAAPLCPSAGTYTFQETAVFDPNAAYTTCTITDHVYTP